MSTTQTTAAKLEQVKLVIINVVAIRLQHKQNKTEELYKYYKDKPEYEAVLENMLNLVPNIIATLSPQEIELFHVKRYMQYLDNRGHSPENILLHLRREPFPSVAYLKPEIAEYLNKYKAEKAPGLSSISF